jgi:hypothetical protein
MAEPFWLSELAEPLARLVLGGRPDKSPDLELMNEEVVTDPILDELTRFAAELLGEPPTVRHRWAGIFGRDGRRSAALRPGPRSRRRLGRSRLLGDWNVLGLACGELVGEAVLGRRKPELDLFDPTRLLR